MTIFFMDGFGQFVGLGTDTPAHLQDAGYLASGSLTVVAGPESGTHAIQIPVLGTFGRAFTVAGPRLVLGFAYRASERGTIASISGVGNLLWPAEITLLGGSSTAVPIPNLWAYYEIVIDKGAATVEIWHNNRQEIVAPLPAPAVDMTTFSLGFGGPAAPATALISGLYASTVRHGPMAIETDMPAADVDVHWVPTAGSVHYPMVNTRPVSDGTFVQSAQSGAQDLFKFPPRAVLDPIVAVGLVARACKTDLDLRQLGLVVGSQGHQQEVVGGDLNLSYRYQYSVFEQAPSGSAWTQEDLDFEPGGIVVRP
ncbi:hypothetical protein ACMHYJ_01995 [Castellaniella hirudinis]|uniref:hypothetical protein n=1 Tax=Castellaniella hirudinis TaxID=1144617 RepID=UPI0039C47B48